MLRALVFAVLAGVLWPSDAIAVEVCYKWPTGEVLRYEIKNDWGLTYKAKIGKVTTSRLVDDVIEFRTGGDDTDFSGVTRVYFREMKRRIINPEEFLDYSFDSRKSYSESATEKDPLLRVFPALIGDFYEIETYGSGNVSRVSGFLDLVARAVSRGLLGSRLLEKTLRDSLAKVFTDNSMKDLFDMAFVVFPESVTQGASWKKRLETQGEIGEIWEMEYKVTSVSASKVAVAISGKFVLTVDGQPIEKDAPISGSAVFDAAAGRLLYSSLKASLKLPNVTYASSSEFKFAKSLKIEEAGPVSFEKPVRVLQEIIERRAIVFPHEIGAPVYADDRCEAIAFFACHNDVVRVVEKRDGQDGGICRIVTALGREGWIKTAHTTEYRKVG